MHLTGRRQCGRLRGLIFAVLATIFILDADGSHAESSALYSRSCSSCHGDVGQGNDAIGAPAIANGEVWYLRAQLEKFKVGIRGSESATDLSRTMATALRQSNTTDLTAIAEFLSELPPPPEPECAPGDAKAGMATLEICASCHGARLQGARALESPRLSHLSVRYITRQIRDFQEGRRGAHPQDETGRRMAEMAQLVETDGDVFDVLAAARQRAGDESCPVHSSR